jgi:hypothetical protein
MGHARLAPGLFGCVAAVFLAAGCSYDIALNAPAADTTGSGAGGAVQRATLTLTATLAASDAALAERIGSPGGVLRAAAVTIERQGSSASRQTDTTDAAGHAAFPGLLPGSYVVSAVRLLTAAEIAQFDSVDADVNAFGGGVVLAVSAPATDAAIPVLAGRRGSLVISELSAPDPFLPSGSQYGFGGYIELYNNADTTIYLDGKIIGRGISWLRDYDSPTVSCAAMERWRNDPDGIWTAFLDAFPGSGRDHALAPGHAVVVATDAIDHSQFVAGLPNLSGADFEFHGSNDVDNPAVPNMLDVGLREWGAGILGHGLWFVDLSLVVFITEPLDVGSLPLDNLPVVNPAHVRVPRAAVLDVLSSIATPELEASLTYLNPPCPQLVNAVFDRQYAGLLEDVAIKGVQRRVFTTLPDGRVILLRTKSSATDFVSRRPPTPGQVP